MLWPKIDKSPTIEGKGTGPNKSNWLFLAPAKFVKSYEALNVIAVGEDYNIEVREEININLPFVDINSNILVKLLKLS